METDAHKAVSDLYLNLMREFMMGRVVKSNERYKPYIENLVMAGILTHDGPIVRGEDGMKHRKTILTDHGRAIYRERIKRR